MGHQQSSTYSSLEPPLYNTLYFQTLFREYSLIFRRLYPAFEITTFKNEDAVMVCINNDEAAFASNAQLGLQDMIKDLNQSLIVVSNMFFVLTPGYTKTDAKSGTVAMTFYLPAINRDLFYGFQILNDVVADINDQVQIKLDVGDFYSTTVETPMIGLNTCCTALLPIVQRPFSITVVCSDKYTEELKNLKIRVQAGYANATFRRRMFAKIDDEFMTPLKKSFCQRITFWQQQ